MVGFPPCFHRSPNPQPTPPTPPPSPPPFYPIFPGLLAARARTFFFFLGGLRRRWWSLPFPPPFSLRHRDSSVRVSRCFFLVCFSKELTPPPFSPHGSSPSSSSPSPRRLSPCFFPPFSDDPRLSSHNHPEKTPPPPPPFLGKRGSADLLLSGKRGGGCVGGLFFFSKNDFVLVPALGLACALVRLCACAKVFFPQRRCYTTG